MKSASELAASRLDSPESHKKRASSLRRLSGSLNSEAARAEITGLSQEELRTLRNAEAVLDRLAKAYTAASKLAQQRQQDEDRAEKVIRASMEANFLGLKTVGERVALIAAVQSYVLRGGSNIKTPRDLDFYFDDSITHLVTTLARTAQSRSAALVVQEAWETFNAARAELEGKHKDLIEGLGKVTGIVSLSSSSSIE